MRDFLNYTLVEADKHAIRVSNLLGLLVLVFALIFVLFFIKKLIYRSTRFDISKKYALYQLSKYVLVVFSIIIGFQIFGVNISLILAGSAALLVGLGLGIQNLFSDFVSGIVILIDGTVKVNDIIDVSGIVCKVQDINIRTTTVLTRDDKYIIVPNSEFTRNNIINWTHSEIASRFEIAVGVSYSSDVHLVMKVLEKVAVEQSGILKKPSPFVRFNDYGDSSLAFTLYFWAEEVFRIENIKSEMRVKIFDAFKENGIQIPFPQRDVHIKNPDK